MIGPESDIYRMQQRAEEIAARYAKLNAAQGHQEWGPREYTEGLVGDIGMLMKLVMAKSGLRDIKEIDKKLRHEIGDSIWSLLVLCKRLNIDPAEAFAVTMDEIEERFQARGAE